VDSGLRLSQGSAAAAVPLCYRCGYEYMPKVFVLGCCRDMIREDFDQRGLACSVRDPPCERDTVTVLFYYIYSVVIK